MSCCRWYSRASRSRSIIVSSSSKCLSLISNFFICVSTRSATKDLILRSSTAAKCLALTADEDKAAEAADCNWPSLIVRSRGVSVAFLSSLSSFSFLISLVSSLFFSSSLLSSPDFSPSLLASESFSVPAMLLFSKLAAMGSSAVLFSLTRFICASIITLGTSSLILANSSMADLAAAAATRGSTTLAKKATVDMIGFPDPLNGIGW